MKGSLPFNPQMLLLARDSRDMSQEELAREAGVTQPFLSKAEHGRDVDPERAKALADALRYPVEFFYQPGQYIGLGLSVVFYRKRSHALVRHMRRLQVEVCLRRLHVAAILREMDIGPSSRPFQRMDIDEYNGDAERIAQFVRSSWALPLGPVQNLIATIESAGGIVFAFSFGTRDIDAVSQWPDDLPPLFFINTDCPPERVRFSLAHELGHVIMHTAATDTMEREADRFAAEFLMPSKLIAPQLAGITLEKAARLKPYWRVSMGALIRHAHAVGGISRDRYSALFRQISYLGLRKDEGSPIEPEQPRMFQRMLDGYMVSRQCAFDAVALDLAMRPEDFWARYGQRQGDGLRLIG